MLSLAFLSDLVHARLLNPAEVEITAAADLSSAGPHDISFLRHPATPGRLEEARKSKAAALLVKEPVAGYKGGQLVVDDPVLALSLVLEKLYPEPDRQPAIHPAAVIDPSAKLGPGCRVEAGAVIGPDCVLGRDCRIKAGAVICRRTRLGDRVVIGPNSVVGGQGFGYAETEQGYKKLRHVGTVEIGADSELGSGCTIDRGLLGRTVIGQGVKFDDQVHIGHNVTVGDYTALAAQVGVGGSTVIGKKVKIGGQAGLVDHITIGDGAVIGAQAGVTKDVPAGAFWTGNPARDVREKRREQAWLRQQSQIRFKTTGKKGRTRNPQKKTD